MGLLARVGPMDMDIGRSHLRRCLTNCYSEARCTVLVGVTDRSLDTITGAVLQGFEKA